MFGNSATNNKFGDYWEGFKSTFSGASKEQVAEQLAKKYNYEQEAKAAKNESDREAVEKQKEKDKYHPLDTNKDGLLDPATDGTNQTIDYESLGELLQKYSSDLNKKQSKNETDYQVNHARLLISGVREDSKQMRDLMEQYLRNNIKFFNEAIKNLQNTYDMLADGPEKDEVGAQLDNLKQLQSQAEVDLDRVKNSKISELERQMSDDLDLTQIDYDTKMYNLLAKNGGTEDAPEIVALNQTRLSDMNSKLAGYYAKWTDLLNTGGFVQGSDEWMTIWKKMQTIGMEQSKNVAEMNKKMDRQQSTFNVPNGLKVMDYFDYMTQNNTHKSVMVGAGNVTVHVNIDNMTGDTKDVEKMTSALESTLKKNNSNLVTQFASDVKANMGSSYNPN
ncbi:hypothetical protein RE628_17725 [Paenibacillus sp. D2_2]|uniref:hypothetical protein n=1 Tax=Paenibacillus sp. D2_2 TaxID=3073092 RepID=UPI002815E4B5|nr:hypothetical protein [Paenibacillus sp. D2_2]WMT39292.1 hypothetical protein RE628_17725 [Paenibacillus sp. D2_2]